MKPFKFTLQALYTLRQRSENDALKVYAASLVNRARAAESVRAAEGELSAAQAAWQQQARAGCPAAEMAQHASHCQRLATQRDQRLALLGTAERKVNAALQDMLSARQRREAVEQLLDKQRRAYKAELARAEQRFLDELAQRRPGLASGFEPLPL